MIPKIIHYCWFGYSEKPIEVIRYIQEWKELNPDFTIKEWNEENFDINMMPFIKQAYSKRKYAFVSDVARLYALISEGGIYLDTDVILLKPFGDELLCNASFCGFEHSQKYKVGTAVIGTIPDFPLWKELFEMYKGMDFIKNGKMQITPNVEYLTNRLLSQGLCQDNKQQTVDGVTVYPCEYFSPKSYVSKRIHKTDKTIAIHNFSATWKPRYERLLLLIWVPLSAKFPKLAEIIKRLVRWH